MVDLSVDAANLLNALIASRDAGAVLKAELAALRSACPETVVLVFEGDHDKGVYYHWVRRVRPDESFEPLPCKSKRNVLALKMSLDRDLGDLRRGVYFFIDRDFDDADAAVLDGTVFMTDRYSIENYFVTEQVLRELLAINFHCHGRAAALREPIVGVFKKVHGEFIEAIRPTNFLLYTCRTCGIDLPPVPKNLNRLISVAVDGVALAGQSPEEFILPARLPSEEENAIALEKFEPLHPEHRYRGKFFFWFFKKWLEALAAERRAGRGVFAGTEVEGAVHNEAFTAENFASKSELPVGFVDFVSQIDWRFAA